MYWENRTMELEIALIIIIIIITMPSILVTFILLWKKKMSHQQQPKRKKRFMLSCGSKEIQSIMSGKTWQQAVRQGHRSRKLCGHIAVAVRRQYDQEVRPGCKASRPAPLWPTSSMQALPSKGFTSFQNRTSSCAPTLQAHEPMADMVHSNHSSPL